MAFENFPYTDLHTLNVDWILKKLRELEELITGMVPGTDTEDLAKKYRQLSKCLDSGPGLIRMIPTNISGITFVGDHIYRFKESSSVMMSCKFTNNTLNDLAANTALLSFESFPADFTAATLRGIRAIVYHADGTVDTTVPVLHFDSGLQKLTLYMDVAIPAGDYAIIAGMAPTSETKDPILCRGMYNYILGQEICHTFLYGTTLDPWMPGDFEYNNNDLYRTDPQYRKTDCSGMVYIAYQAHGFKPSRGATAKPYWSDGIVLAYADKGDKLDTSNGLPGDIICYQSPSDLNSIPHCTLYAGGDTVYEMSSNYPAKENAAGCIDSQGPYAITTTPASEYRMNTYNRYLVRFL